MKKYLSIISMVVGILLLLGLGFYIRYRSTSGSAENNEPPGSLPATEVDFSPDAAGSAPLGSAVGTFKKSIDAEVEAFRVLSSEDILYLNKAGEVVRQASDGQVTILSSSPLSYIRSARFSYDGKFLLVGYGPRTIQWSVFDVSKKTWFPIDGATQSAIWSPVDSRIAYLSAEGIQIIDPSAAKPKSVLLQKGSFADAILAWPAADRLIISDRPSGEINGYIWGFDIKTKSVSLLGEFVGYQSIWNSDASTGMVFRGTPRGKGGTIYQVNREGGGEKQFNFLTLPSKCIFFTEKVPTNTATSTKAATSTTVEFLACAVPEDQDRLFSESLPDAWLMRSLFTKDGLYKIDLTTGHISSLIARSEVAFDAELLQIQNGRVFFRNRLDSKIYSLAKD